MLLNENNMVETFFDVIPFGIYVVDVKTYDIVFMNKALTAQRGDLTGQICHRSLYEEDAPCLHCPIGRLVGEDMLPTGKTIVYEHFNPVDDHWYQMQEKAMHWPDGKTVKCSIAVDITELKDVTNRLAEAHAELALKNRELRALSITDRLTAVFNRLKMDEVFTMEAERAERYNTTFSVIILDLDDFKAVNDTYGHNKGDEVLAGVAKSLSLGIRKTDILGRWGGEEFLIICPETPLGDARTLADKLRKSLSEVSYGEAGAVTASFGVAQYREGKSVSDLVRRADRALYRAKAEGKNCVMQDE